MTWLLDWPAPAGGARIVQRARVRAAGAAVLRQAAARAPQLREPPRPRISRQHVEHTGSVEGVKVVRALGCQIRAAPVRAEREILEEAVIPRASRQGAEGRATVAGIEDETRQEPGPESSVSAPSGTLAAAAEEPRKVPKTATHARKRAKGDHTAPSMARCRAPSIARLSSGGVGSGQPALGRRRSIAPLDSVVWESSVGSTARSRSASSGSSG